MGRPKAYLRIGDRELLERVLDAGRRACTDLVLAGDASPRCLEALARYGWEPAGGDDPRGDGTDEPDPAAPARLLRRGDAFLRIVPDRRPARGPLAGLDAGLAAARYRRCFLTGCDYPFLDPALVRRLLDELAAWTRPTPAEPAAVVVRTGDGVQPLCAAYTRSAAKVARRRLEEGRLRLLDFLEELRVRELAPADVAADPETSRRWLVDVDTPEALERARRLAGPAEGAEGG